MQTKIHSKKHGVKRLRNGKENMVTHLWGMESRVYRMEQRL